MKVSFDLGGKEASEQDQILTRAYLAAVIGPFRRPQGRTKLVGVIPVGGVVQIAKNSTTNRVLFVTVNNITVGPQVLVTFAVGGDSNAASALLVGTAGFILLPGEQLTATAALPGLNLSVTEHTF